MRTNKTNETEHDTDDPGSDRRKGFNDGLQIAATQRRAQVNDMITRFRAERFGGAKADSQVPKPPLAERAPSANERTATVDRLPKSAPLQPPASTAQDDAMKELSLRIALLESKLLTAIGAEQATGSKATATVGLQPKAPPSERDRAQAATPKANAKEGASHLSGAALETLAKNLANRVYKLILTGSFNDALEKMIEDSNSARVETNVRSVDRSVG